MYVYTFKGDGRGEGGRNALYTENPSEVVLYFDLYTVLDISKHGL